MRLFNPRLIVLRLIVVVVLGGFVYPFLPEKQKWEIEASFGSPTADSLLNEYYNPPVEGALQFALEIPFAIKTRDGQHLVQRRDVRYVELGEMLWRRGEHWVVHLRRDAVARLRRHVESQPGEPLLVVLDYNWEAPLMLSEVRSPLHIDPRIFADDRSAITYEVLDSWYPVF